METKAKVSVSNELVWTKDEKEWKEGTVVGKEENGEGCLVLLEDGSIRTVQPTDIHPRNEEEVGADDLIQMDYIHEPGVLHSLRTRYRLDFIYTYCGPILVAINPMRRVPLYGAPVMSMYTGTLIGQVQPHVYAVAEQAFRNMMEDEQPQSILVAGESGAGKTESAKYVMQYLAQKGRKKEANKKNKQMDNKTVEIQVLRSNPLLEAFGNAKTVRNDNSSRFGKYVELHFDGEGNITGARIRTYLLERTRVVDLAHGERSYHIFYQLCAEASPMQKDKYKLHGGAKSFRYLAQSETYHLSAASDREQFLETMEAMEAMGISQEDRDHLLQIVAAILHLGNITFSDPNDGIVEGAVLSDEHADRHLAFASELLGCSSHALFAALTQRVIEARGEKIIKPLNAEEASDSRDSLAKTIYAGMFEWLVSAINRCLGSEDHDGDHFHPRQTTISILDIYGFESFENNSFEQLCINLANEKLQQQFNQQIFKREQEEYQNEGIDWSYIDFRDNQDVLDLMESEPHGILAQVDEACRLPKSTNKDLCVSLRKQLSSHPRFVKSDLRPECFGVKHYAGEVLYNSEFLLEKNRDYVVTEHATLISQSTYEFLRTIFQMTEKKSHARSTFRLSSVGFQFKQQLNELMKTLRTTQPNYIRCIKPNPQGEPGEFDAPYSLEQLRCGGVMEAVRIANQGFPARKPYLQFALRYGLLVPTSRYGPRMGWDEDAAKSITKNVLQGLKLDGWQLGCSRVFLKAGCLAVLESALNRRWSEAALLIQASWKAYKAKKNYQRLLRCVIMLQAQARSLAAQRQLKHLREERAAVIIQSYRRMIKHRRAYVDQKRMSAAVVIQSYARMWLARTWFHRETEAGKRAQERIMRERAAIVLQKFARRRIAIARAQKRKAKRDYVSKLEKENMLLAEKLARVEADVAVKEEELQRLRSNHDALQSTFADGHEGFGTLAGVENVTQGILQETSTPSSIGLQEEKGFYAPELQELQETLSERDAELEKLRADLRAMEVELSESLSSASIVVEQVSHPLQQKIQELEQEKLLMEEEISNRMTELQAENTRNEERILELLVELDRVGTQLSESSKNKQEEDTKLSLLEEELVKERQRAEHWASSAASYEMKLADALCQLDLLQNRAIESEMSHGRGGKKQAIKQKNAANFVHRSEVDNFVRASFSRNVQTIFLDHKAGIVPVGAGKIHMADDSFHQEVIGVPHSSWLIATCLFQWSSRTAKPKLPVAGGFYDGTDEWLSAEGALNVMTSRVKRVASSGTLETQAYWLAVAIALEGFLAHRFASTEESHARRHLHACRQLVHSLVNRLVHLVLSSMKSDLEPHLMRCSQDKQDLYQAPHAGTAASHVTLNLSGHDGPTQDLDGAHASPWDDVVSCLARGLENFRSKALPPASVRYLVLQSLKFADAELLNTLLMRRECCSTRNARSLAAGVILVEEWAKREGECWCGTKREVSAALCHIREAAHFLQVHKEDLSRAHRQGVQPSVFLARVCPALSLTQVVQLTAHHHDDWLAPRATSHATVALLSDLRRAITVQQSSGGSECLLFDVEERLFGSAAQSEDAHPEPIQSSARAIASKTDEIQAKCSSMSIPEKFAKMEVSNGQVESRA